MDPSSFSKRVLGHQYTANPASLPLPPKCIAPLPPSSSLPNIPVTNPLPPVTPLVTTAPPTVPPPQPPANPPTNPMSTTTSTAEIKAAFPADFSGEIKDAVRWLKAMEAYFWVNPSTYTTDDAKLVTLLNKMSQGQGRHFVDTWLDILANSTIKATDKDFNKVKEAFTAKDELNNLRQTMTRKDNGFQTYLSKFQNSVVQSQAGDTSKVRRLFAKGLDIQIATMIYSMEKVPDTLNTWMNKAINFHWQKARNITLKKGHGLPLSSFSSNSCSTRDPDAMDVDTIHLKKLSPADWAHCIREGLCFRCRKKRHSTNECWSSQTQGKSKGNNHPQQVRNTETSSSPTPNHCHHRSHHPHQCLYPEPHHQRQDHQRYPSDLEDLLWRWWRRYSCCHHLS